MTENRTALYKLGNLCFVIVFEPPRRNPNAKQSIHFVNTYA